MTPIETLALARELELLPNLWAPFVPPTGWVTHSIAVDMGASKVLAFAERIRADERERVLKVADRLTQQLSTEAAAKKSTDLGLYRAAQADGADYVTSAIRSMKP